MHSPGTLLLSLSPPCRSLGTAQELSRGTTWLQHLQAWGMALPEPQTTTRNGSQGWRAIPRVSQSSLSSPGIHPSNIYCHVLFLPRPMEDASGPQTLEKRRPLLPCFVQELVTLKQKEGERGRKMLYGVLRISTSQQMC